jgi:ATP-dependent RNA helicase DHX37/DHR1
MLAGFIDQVAARDGVPNRHRIGDTSYTPLCSNRLRDGTAQDKIFIHPSSCLYRVPPQYVTFTDLVRTSKVFMKTCTAIDDSSWLAAVGRTLCHFSKPLENPAPEYDPANDDIICHCSPTFGDFSIPLAPMQISYPKGVDRARYFARFFLEGRLFAPLAAFADALVSKPTLMTNKKIPVTQAKIMGLIQPLLDHGVYSRQDLIAIWTGSDPKFLLRAYQLWLPTDFHQKVADIWPPIK